MTTQTEALKLALEALEELNNTNGYWWQEVDEQTIRKIDPTITAIKEALAQPEQCTYPNCDYPCMNLPDCKQPKQKQWVGLTGEEIINMSCYDLQFAAFIGEVERKLKEKNTNA